MQKKKGKVSKHCVVDDAMSRWEGREQTVAVAVAEVEGSAALSEQERKQHTWRAASMTPSR